MLSFILHYDGKFKNSKNNDSLYYFLKNELTQFENEFTKYLLDQTQTNYQYNTNTYNLIKKLEISNDSKVLNFNYTRPSQLINNTFVNVHGDINNEDIIIGIDSSKFEYNNHSYQFTKTYRKTEKLFKQDNGENEDVLKYKISDILFYGHSLNEQDYSYFQTIFDKFDLYSSKLKLFFYYTIYDIEKEEEIKLNQLTSIIKLIEIYGETLDNKHKGKNLLHKLLNEKRLIIKQI